MSPFEWWWWKVFSVLEKKVVQRKTKGLIGRLIIMYLFQLVAAAAVFLFRMISSHFNLLTDDDDDDDAAWRKAAAAAAAVPLSCVVSDFGSALLARWLAYTHRGLLSALLVCCYLVGYLAALTACMHVCSRWMHARSIGTNLGKGSPSIPTTDRPPAFFIHSI